jgi:hypothetical protein
VTEGIHGTERATVAPEGRKRKSHSDAGKQSGCNPTEHAAPAPGLHSSFNSNSYDRREMSRRSSGPRGAGRTVHSPGHFEDSAPVRHQDAVFIFQFFEQAHDPHGLFNNGDLTHEMTRHPDLLARFRVLGVDLSPRNFTQPPLIMLYPYDRGIKGKRTAPKLIELRRNVGRIHSTSIL